MTRDPAIPPPTDGTRDTEPSMTARRRAVYGWATLALLLGLVLTGIASRLQARHQRISWLAGQHALADQSYAALNHQLRSAERMLRAVQSLFLSSDEVTPAEFADMYANMRPRERFPSLQALAYAQRAIRPDGTHYITTMVAPTQGNQAVEGLDVASQPPNLAGLLRSIDSDQPTLSGPFRLVQQAGSATPNDGVTLRLPIYTPGPSPRALGERRARVRGSIAVSFQVGELIGDALPKQALQELHVRISDVTGGAELLLFDSQATAAMPASEPDFSRTLTYGGRTWRVQMRPLDAAPAMLWLHSALPGGLLASILLALLVFSVANTRQRAIALASRMSRRYRESEARARALNEQQRQLNQTLSHQASHDALTDLYNRREFEQRLQATLAAAAGMPKALLLYIDLDQFKLINDTSGHLAGDQLLVQLATVMRRQLRDDDMLARLGGDEFGVLATGLPDVGNADALADRVRHCIDEFVFVWENHSHRISASIGGVLIERAGLVMKDVLAQADTACYAAKELGRNRVRFHSERDGQAAHRRDEMKWADRLRHAIKEQRLVLMYQEIRALRPELPDRVSAELLLRFRDDDGQLVAPGAFMPAAERYGLMPAIDRWVVETALAHFDQLHPDGAALRMVAINLSGASIEDQTYADRIIELLRLHSVEPARVCFEITETVAVSNIAQMVSFIERLRAAGCKIALDDFGTGMSSFTYLKNLPVDMIKIDGSFVRDMLTDPVSHAMVQAVADIGRRLGLEVVAEWVADAATVDALLALGVGRGQGFKLHVPELANFQRSDPLP